VTWKNSTVSILTDQVVLGDDGLAEEGDHLLAQVDQRLDPVDERDDQVQPRLEGLAVAAQPLHVPRLGLRHDPHRAHGHQQNQGDDDDADDPDCVHRGYSLG